MKNQPSQTFKQSLQQSVSNNFGDYEVGDQINHGGFGHIFKLKSIKSKQIYALKAVGIKNKKQQSKIKNQINIHQSLKNRYVLQFNNKFHDKENYYIVLEYCQKGDLQNYMLKNYTNKPMPIEIVKKFSQQIARGISYLHKQNVIHGDIKPANILITQKDQIKICDFGLSTKIKNGEKIKGTKGTKNFLAPQCNSQYDQKVDVWAFGVSLYLMASGQLPFVIESHKNLNQSLRQQMLDKLKYPPTIPYPLKHLLKKIFINNPQKRYSIQDVLKHQFYTGQKLEQQLEKQIHKDIKPERMRSYTSSNLQTIKQNNQLKRIQSIDRDKFNPNSKYRTNSQNRQYSSKGKQSQTKGKQYQSRGKQYQGRGKQNNLKNRQIQTKNTKQDYINKILQKKSNHSTKNTYNNHNNDKYHPGLEKQIRSNHDKQNNMNYENVRHDFKQKIKSNKTTYNSVKTDENIFFNTDRNSYLKLEQRHNTQRNCEFIAKRSLSPLNTQNMVIKPIIQKNCIIKIDKQGISRRRQQLIQQNNTKFIKQFKVSPNGTNILIKCDKVQKFYKIQQLPQKYYKQYQKCKQVTNSIKNHTTKLQFCKKYIQPQYKEISIKVMFSGRIVAKINSDELETTEKEISSCITFGENNDKTVSKENQLRFQVKAFYQRLVDF